MATNTSLLGLTKPDYSENQDIGVINANMDTIDREIGKRTRVYNLLDNSYFPSAHVINQRGETTYTGNSYSIDRWRAYHASTTHTVTASGIAVSATDNNPNIYQVLDPNIIDTTKTYTVAVCDSAGNVTVRAMKPTTATYSPACIYISGSNILFRINGVNTWRWAALYEGEYTIDTLPTYIPKENEMLACRHCAITLGGVFRYRAVQIVGSIIDFSIPLPVQLRARPSFDTSALTVYSFPDMNAQSGFTFAVVQETANGIVIRATKAGHGLSDGVLGIATNTLFSADR